MGREEHKGKAERPEQRKAQRPATDKVCRGTGYVSGIRDRGQVFVIHTDQRQGKWKSKHRVLSLCRQNGEPFQGSEENRNVQGQDGHHKQAGTFPWEQERIVLRHHPCRSGTFHRVYAYRTGQQNEYHHPQPQVPEGRLQRGTAQRGDRVPPQPFQADQVPDGKDPKGLPYRTRTGITGKTGTFGQSPA